MFESNHKYPFIGEHKRAYIPATIEEVDRNKLNDFEEGYTIFYYDLVTNRKYLTKDIPELVSNKESIIIKTITDIDFKEKDKIRLENGSKYYSIQSVNLVLPEKYKKNVRLFPNSKNKYIEKIIELV